MKKVMWFVGIVLCGAGVRAETNAVVDMPPVTVTATAISKYRAETVQSAQVPFNAEESPVVVDVLTEDFIRDRNPTDLNNLVTSQPGIYSNGKTFQARTPGQYTIRGIYGHQVLLNGVVPLTAGMGMFMDPVFLERVEVAKGPVGAVYGGEGGALGSYGAAGAVVVYQKRARSDAEFGSAELRTSFTENGAERYRLRGDVNGAVGESLWVRLPVGIDVDKPFWLPDDGYRGWSFSIAPSFRAEGESVCAGVDTSLMQSDRPAYQGIAIYNGDPRTIAPAPAYDWESNFALREMRDKYLGFSVLPWLEVDVTDSLTLRTGGGMAWNSIDYDHLGPSAGPSGAPIAATPYQASYGDLVAYNYSAYLQARYTLETDSLKQTLVTGIDWTRKIREGRSGAANVATPSFKSRTDVATRSDVVKYGVFLNDGIELGDFRAVLGVRYDRYRSDQHNTGSAWSPRIGLSYLVTPWLIPFANALWSSSPNFGHTGEDGKELTTSWRTTQYEAGLRIAPVEDVWVTVSAFHIGQKHVPMAIPPLLRYYASNGEFVSKGAELSVAGNILRNWSVYAAYALVNIEDKTYDTYSAYGYTDYVRFPQQAISLNTTYQIEGSALDGVVLGFGYRYRTGYELATRGFYMSPEYHVDGYQVFDASVEMPLPKSWNLGESSVSFAVKNIFDKRYIESSHNMQCFVGDPRTYEIAFRCKF